MDPVITRRSIRKYKDIPIEEEKIKTLLEAAMSAPSAHNEQPWHFIVVGDRAILDKIPSFHPFSQMLYKAPLAIVVCSDVAHLENDDFWPQDCSAATQNILVEANYQGLGGVWLGVFPKRNLIHGVSELFLLPEEIIPFCIISLGYPEFTKEPSDRYSKERVHKNKW